MRRSISAFLLPLATLAACATPGYRSGIPAYSDERPDRVETPLSARLYDSQGRLEVALNRPAHVAVFEIISGEGVALLYPRASELSFFDQGRNEVLPAFTANRFWRYDGVRVNRARFAGYADDYRYGYSAGFRRSQPHHLLLIASERPLQVERFQRGGDRLSRVMGTARYSAVNQARVVDDLLATVVPAQPDESWSADVLTVWPSLRDGYEASAVLPARCGNGAVVYAPLELYRYACYYNRASAQPGADSVGGHVTPPPPPAGGEVQKPTRRRPVPGDRTPQPEYNPPRIASDARGGEPRITELRRALRERQEPSANFRHRPGGGSQPAGRSGTGNTGNTGSTRASDDVTAVRAEPPTERRSEPAQQSEPRVAAPSQGGERTSTPN